LLFYFAWRGKSIYGRIDVVLKRNGVHVTVAIDKNRTKLLIQQMDELFEMVTEKVDPKTREFLKQSIMGPAFAEIRKLVEESRPPKMYLVGRSGHGKSSLLNALARKQVAEVGDIKPTTPQSVPYVIKF
jgi:putative ribosome biogenesis GTPase RsgA